MYSIQITYTTGDSFHTEEGRKSLVGHIWKDIEKARITLKYIKEHYKTHKYGRMTKTLEKKIKKQPWFVKSEYDDIGEYSVGVPTDDGDIVKISAFWMGYFESLEAIEIVIDEEEDMKYTF